MGGSGKRRLPMVCASAIGKAFGLAAATRTWPWTLKYEDVSRNWDYSQGFQDHGILPFHAVSNEVQGSAATCRRLQGG
jgi:hypothetical protein